MEATPHKEEVFTLILADMRNRKLIMGLEAAGLTSEDFYIDLVNLILSKIGFENPQDEELFTWYENTVEEIIEKNLSYFKKRLYDLAERMYNLLLLKKHVMCSDPLKRSNDIMPVFMKIAKKIE